MARRRRVYRPRVRDVSVPLTLATAGWGASWGHLAGFALLGLAGAACWPVLVLFALSVPGAFPGILVPRRWRVRYRKRRADAGRGRGRSGYMPGWFRRAVGRADRWRCVKCGARAPLEWDHIVPWACGGLTVLWNVALLCQPCNGLKSCYYPPWDGYAEHGPMSILRAERRARLNPLRWARLAWSL